MGYLYGEVCKVGRVEIDDTGFDVMTGVDEREVICCATGESVSMARACRVEDVGDCR